MMDLRYDTATQRYYPLGNTEGWYFMGQIAVVPEEDGWQETEWDNPYAVAAKRYDPPAIPRHPQRHGWVTPLPSGIKARCGGPGMCVVCQQELRALKDARTP